MTRRNIFLDDIRTGPPNHIIAKTAEECILLLKEEEPVSHLSLDHDLGSNRNNGYEVVLYLLQLNHPAFPDRITIHSANAGAGKRMYHSLLEGKATGLVPVHVKILYRPLPIKL
ncbi:cyclic-phosphate processing receiver domain-containing protein [Bacillus piscicola]|uniref:cyclic-phosphate processing receiver domain-containing protein n=1 Tax=Bacillus piscicola TaxID=1632684 RepID=UPI001F088A77|nr:cyclic-phosphate processing receiver domain-containing protein [Bacillus piscicola]